MPNFETIRRKVLADLKPLEEAPRQSKEDSLKAIEAELKAIEARMAMTRRELTNITYRLPGFVGAMEEWSTLGPAAREQAQKTAVSALLKSAFETLGLSRPHELPEDVLQRADGLIKRGILDKANLQRLVEIRQRLAAAKTDQDVIQVLAQVDEGLAVLALTETKMNREEICSAMLGVIDLVNSHTAKIPTVGLLIADGQIATDAAYGWLSWCKSKERINQLDALGTQQLEALKKLTALHKADTDKRAALLKEKAGLALETSAKP